MKDFSRRLSPALILLLFLTVTSLKTGFSEDDAVHIASGVLKHLDRVAKTIVVKTDEGVEYTVKWTDKTTWEATKESGKGLKEGSKVAVKYTEKGGEKTAVGIKDLGKDAAKAVH
jgi:Cu/Ag efflux protein CusF